jgi:hypothetical membrane protein
LLVLLLHWYEDRLAVRFNGVSGFGLQYLGIYSDGTGLHDIWLCWVYFILEISEVSTFCIVADQSTFATTDIIIRTYYSRMSRGLADI